MKAEEVIQSNSTENTESQGNQIVSKNNPMQSKPYFKCVTDDPLGSKVNDTNDARKQSIEGNAEKPFRCTYPNCDVSYKGLSRLIVHLRTHTGEKPFKCTFANCNKTFNEKGNLKTHMRIHTGEKPFQCSYEGCKSSFKAKGQLAYHMKIHQKSKPYNCHICQKRYTRISTLKIHSQLHQRKNDAEHDNESNAQSDNCSSFIGDSNISIRNNSQIGMASNLNVSGSISIINNNNNYIDFGIQSVPQMNTNTNVNSNTNMYNGGFNNYTNPSYLNPSLYDINPQLATYLYYNPDMLNNYLSFIKQGPGYD